ncbi:response regulator [Oceanobacillus kapialis]|uniref:Response regulator n=1 Tax=Oceanobacillus kapialis TaxID=481353 RepID=A0ABW5Q2T7_9BACI
MMMKAVLVDDEPLALGFLKRQLEKVSSIQVLETFTYFDSSSNISVIKETDIVFMDIEMPERNGFQLAEQLLELNPGLEIIFVTAFNQYAVQAFEVHALDYILKPVQTERLKKTVKRAEERINAKQEAISEKPTKLCINVSGELMFHLTNKDPEIVTWRTLRARELFLYLLHNRDRSINKDVLTELLWAEVDQEKAYAQLYTTIYHIRKTLSNYRDYLTLKSVQGGYKLILSNTIIDLYVWEKKLKNLSTLEGQTIPIAEELMAIYKGGYLQEYGYVWAEAERVRLEQQWVEAAQQLAAYYHDQGNFSSAERWYRELCNKHPDDEISNYQLFKLYALTGKNKLAEKQYQIFKKALEDIGTGVPHTMEKWYMNWKQGIARKTSM